MPSSWALRRDAVHTTSITMSEGVRLEGNTVVFGRGGAVFAGSGNTDPSLLSVSTRAALVHEPP